MPQIKKSTPIYFKPSHETAEALAKLRERYPGKTKTAIIELTIAEHLKSIEENPAMFMLDEFHGLKGPETMVTIVK